MRTWLAIALLAASWLFGLSYYQAANVAVWAELIVAGTALLWNTAWFALPRAEGAVALVVLVAGLVAGLWPFDMPLGDYVSFVPLATLTIGLALHVLLRAPHWVAMAANTLIAASIVLVVQRLALFGYE